MASSPSHVYTGPPAAGLARSAALAGAALAALMAIATGRTALAALALCLAVGVVCLKAVESWPVLLTVLFVVVFLIPMRRYKLPGNLPFDIEPYRLVVFGLALVWIGALLVDGRVKLRRTPLDPPMLVVLLAVLASISVNTGFIESIGVATDVVKAVSFFFSFVLVYFLLTSVVTDRAQLDFVVRVMVSLSVAVACAAIVEYRTGFNVFNHLSKVAPFLTYEGDLDTTSLDRSGALRVYASAQHPIALSGALAMVLPLALYLAQSTARFRWWLAAFLVGLGAVAALSRTGVVALVLAGLTMLAMRPRDTKRLVPLVVPALVIIFFALPNALGVLKGAFFPEGGLIAQQSNVVPDNPLYGNGRLADLGPVFHEWEERPFFGRGWGSRLPSPGPRQNAAILDDQWLDFALELGFFGVVAFVWLIARAVRRLGRVARGDPSSLGLLAGAVGASIVSCSVGMITYDAFSFLQVTMLFFVVLALAGVVIRIATLDSEAREEVLSGA